MRRRASAAAAPLQPMERELAELGEECARVLLLLQRLAKQRATRGDVSDTVGELSATVLHLHAHTKGLDELIDASELT